jgi:hypothetical protein
MIYQLAEHNTVHRLSDNAYIPKDDRNVDYQQYQQWLAAGNAPLPAPAPPPAKEPTLTEKLAAAGITLDELKEALK